VALPLLQSPATMWKDTTVRKVLPVARKRSVLPWSVLPLVLAVGASLVGFLASTPSIAGLSGGIAACFAAVFVVVFVAGLLQKRS
jgi:uncharacterized membrane protein YtjA (UPF0391 family)